MQVNQPQINVFLYSHSSELLTYPHIKQMFRCHRGTVRLARRSRSLTKFVITRYIMGNLYARPEMSYTRQRKSALQELQGYVNELGRVTPPHLPQVAIE